MHWPRSSEQRPELRRLEAAVREADADLSVAETLQRPNYGLGVRYQREGGDNIVLGGVTFVLPVFSKGQEITRHRHGARGARLRAELDAVRARTRIELESALAAYERRANAARVLETEALPGLDDNGRVDDAQLRRRPDWPARRAGDSARAARHTFPTSVCSARGRIGQGRGGRRRGSAAMKTIQLFMLLGCAAAACGRGPRAPGTARGYRHASRRGDAPPHSDGGEVRIEAGMLRDLRVTTAQVESRRGGELVTLLGELAVDERSYAEVGVPVAARVVRLLAGAGDRVRAGQALLELQSRSSDTRAPTTCPPARD